MKIDSTKISTSSSAVITSTKPGQTIALERAGAASQRHVSGPGRGVRARPARRGSGGRGPCESRPSTPAGRPRPPPAGAPSGGRASAGAGGLRRSPPSPAPSPAGSRRAPAPRRCGRGGAASPPARRSSRQGRRRGASRSSSRRGQAGKAVASASSRASALDSTVLGVAQGDDEGPRSAPRCAQHVGGVGAGRRVVSARGADAGDGGKPFLQLPVEAVLAVAGEEVQQAHHKRPGETQQRGGEGRRHAVELGVQPLHELGKRAERVAPPPARQGRAWSPRCRGPRWTGPRRCPAGRSGSGVGRYSG